MVPLVSVIHYNTL